MRNHNEEYRDSDVRKYAYDFDGVIRRYLLRTLQPYLHCKGSALELGCYKGDMTEQLLGYFGAVTVVEAASELANVVRNRFPGKVEVLTDRFESVSLSAAYDNIFLIHTLEHLDDPVAILTRVLGWLTPQGRLFVAVPNANALSRQIAVKMGLVEHHAAVTPRGKGARASPYLFNGCAACPPAKRRLPYRSLWRDPREAAGELPVRQGDRAGNRRRGVPRRLSGTGKDLPGPFGYPIRGVQPKRGRRLARAGGPADNEHCARLLET